jgi:hypothetical protein
MEDIQRLNEQLTQRARQVWDDEFAHRFDTAFREQHRRFAETVTADLQQRLNEVMDHARVAQQARQTSAVQQATGTESLEQKLDLLQRDLQAQNAWLLGMQRDIGTLAEVIRRLLDQGGP